MQRILSRRAHHLPPKSPARQLEYPWGINSSFMSTSTFDDTANAGILIGTWISENNTNPTIVGMHRTTAVHEIADISMTRNTSHAPSSQNTNADEELRSLPFPAGIVHVATRRERREEVLLVRIYAPYSFQDGGRCIKRRRYRTKVHRR